MFFNGNFSKIYASGKHLKYSRPMTGYGSDWIFRQEVKHLLDDIIVRSTNEFNFTTCFHRNLDKEKMQTLAAIVSNPLASTSILYHSEKNQATLTTNTYLVSTRFY